MYCFSSIDGWRFPVGEIRLRLFRERSGRLQGRQALGPPEHLGTHGRGKAADLHQLLS